MTGVCTIPAPYDYTLYFYLDAPAFGVPEGATIIIDRRMELTDKCFVGVQEGGKPALRLFRRTEDGIQLVAPDGGTTTHTEDTLRDGLLGVMEGAYGRFERCNGFFE